MGCAESSVKAEDETPRQRREALATAKGCTDVLWLLIFIAFWVVMIAIGVFALVYGNPLGVINGYDSYGNTCGVKTNKKLLNNVNSGLSTIDKPYLLFFDIKHLRKSLKVCVKECPTKTLQTMGDIKDYYVKTGNNLCNYKFNPKDVKDGTVDENINNLLGPCPKLPIYESIPVLHRCFPKPAKEVAEHIFTNFYSLLNSWDAVEQILGDLYSSWRELLIFSFVALVVSLIMVSVLHLLATLVSWIFMIVVSISCIFGTCLLWFTYYELKNGLREIPSNMILMESLRNEKAFFWYSIIATIITVILLLLVFVMRNRVAFLAALFKETASCLGSIPGLFIQPIITFFFLLIFFIAWVYITVCLATASYSGVQNVTTDTSNSLPNTNNNSIYEKLTELIDFVDATWIKGMWWFYLIGLIWTSEFILACQQMTIAGAVSHWYFRGPYAESTPVLYSIKKLLIYHIGSVAKGSFLITLFKIPRLILTYLHSKLKSNSDKGSECAKCGLKCGICCFYCLEKFIAYLNHNAYTIIAIENVHFCKAAGIAFSTLVNNALQIITINSVGDFILFLGKCTVTAVTGSLGLIFLKRNKELHFYAAPTLLICIFSFLIAHCILSLYEMVVDTLFICVCEDRKINGAEGRWNQSALASFADEKAIRKSSQNKSESQPGIELQALQSENVESK